MVKERKMSMTIKMENQAMAKAKENPKRSVLRTIRTTIKRLKTCKTVWRKTTRENITLSRPK